MADDNKTPLSFNFKRKSDTQKLATSKLDDGTVQDVPKGVDYIKKVEDNKINGTFKEPKKKELVIPLITKNRWRIPDASVSNDKAHDEETKSLEALAAEEIIKETREASEGWENRGNSTSSTLEIPLFMQNQIPSGYETDNKVDVSLRPDQSTLEDYEAVPIDGYGQALLRGMGWKESEGIGLSRKGVVTPLQVSLRPKGLGLGADLSYLKKATEVTDSTDGAEKLAIVPKAFVKIVSGKHEGSYGQIESLDENNGTALVRLAIGNSDVVSVTELFLKPVTAKEYKELSRFLNQEKYAKFKAEQDRENAEKTEERRKRDGHSKKRSKRSRSRSRDRTRDRSGSRERKSDKKSSSADKHGRDEKPRAWLYPMLRVRCIDSKFKDGKYYKTKMVVVDVISEKHCICRTEDGKLLDKISTSKLETVIPRTEPAYVMVVSGKRRSQIGQVIEKDKERCKATIQILPDRDEIFQIGYDDICEYTGDIRNLC